MFARLFRWLTILVLGATLLVPSVFGQEQSDRKVKSKVDAKYPELAKSMHLTGAVKVELTITAAGTVKSTKVIGGHPMLVESVLAVINKWKFEPAKDETTQVMTFNFHP